MNESELIRLGYQKNWHRNGLLNVPA